MSLKLGLIILGGIFFSPSQASFEGIDPSKLKNSPVAFYSRPCCSFANSFFQHQLKLAGLYIDQDKFKDHNFARLGKKDSVGLTYTCRGGFLDISHLRDTADWAAHVLYKIREWMGSGKTIEIRNEDGFKSRKIYFPHLSQHEILSLTENDYNKLAMAIAFGIAILHEIPSTFNIQSGSAFSVEDAYSNILGAYLGVMSARSPLPFNEAMTRELKNITTELGILTKKQTIQVHKMVEGSWWKKTMFGGYESVMKRDFSYQGAISPFLVESVPYCNYFAPFIIEAPDLLSTNRSVDDYFEIQGQMNKKLQKKLARLGSEVNNPMTQNDFGIVLDAIKEKFIRSFGEDTDLNPAIVDLN